MSKYNVYCMLGTVEFVENRTLEIGHNDIHEYLFLWELAWINDVSGLIKCLICSPLVVERF